MGSLATDSALWEGWVQYYTAACVYVHDCWVDWVRLDVGWRLALVDRLADHYLLVGLLDVGITGVLTGSLVGVVIGVSCHRVIFIDLIE